MRFVIVTGMSGAGKSTALKKLEDTGFFCVDNLPVMLIEKFAEISHDDKLEVDNVAIGVDIRSGESLGQLSLCLEELKRHGYNYEILFLEANEKTLVKRYKETRRKHPLSRGGRINEGIVREREKIEFLKQRADYIIDTSSLLTRELNTELEKIFVRGETYSNIIITIISFGFKYGIPGDSDLVFDARFLPNPYYVPELRPLTGNDAAVSDMVKNCEEYGIFMDKLFDMLKFTLPMYKREGKNQLVVSVGCTGGKHRSVTVVNDLYKRLEQLPYTARIYHRDITKDRIVKGE
ncbi:MAG: RNase adapter RapZ [Clostridium sp.]|nr:RNase adapter RapZ [Clostridium sp.]MCM1208136.1 RNase adapter RapZ [Ruminococcus sp.]